MNKFTDFGLKPEILDAIDAKGFEEPSEIQSKAIPLILGSEGHVVGKAQTGTGKTAAFGLPVLNLINSDVKQLQALVVVPTRELAIQVTEEINSLSGRLPVLAASVYGGQSYSEQIKHFRRGDQIIVGTPGRLVDHIQNGKLDLSTIDYVILDEADEMLNMGFLDDVDLILSEASEQKRVLLFSATMKKKMVALIDKHMPSYESVEVEAKYLTTDLTEQVYLEVSESQKLEALCRFVDLEADFYGFVFCRTKREVDELKEKLNLRGYFADCIHGDILQRKRERVLERFRSRNINILIATDVAARGIDVGNLTHVVNYHIPEDPESYVHRIGRTGRAGQKGKAITLVTPREFSRLRFIIKKTSASIEQMKNPTVAELKEMYEQKIQVELRSKMGSVNEFYEYLANKFLCDNDPIDLVSSLLQRAYPDVEKILRKSSESRKVAQFELDREDGDSRGGSRRRGRNRGGRRGGFSDRRSGGGRSHRGQGRGNGGGRSRGYGRGNSGGRDGSRSDSRGGSRRRRR